MCYNFVKFGPQVLDISLKLSQNLVAGKGPQDQLQSFAGLPDFAGRII